MLEKASQREMQFAGHYLNIAGIVFVTLGIIVFLQDSLHARASGISQTMAGMAAGLGLIGAGHCMFRRGFVQFAHPLLAGGFAVLLLTNCVAHFYFHLIDRFTLFGSTAFVVAWSGLSVFRYDSRLIGNFMLAVLYLGPFFMHFGMQQFGVLFAYLVAIHVGTTFVAFFKKWDYFLVVSFLGTYGLFYYHFGSGPAVPRLALITVVYLLFIVSNNLLHFVRGSDSGFNLSLSFINPTVYAAASYSLLLNLPNALAMLLYLVLSLVHLVLCALAVRRRQDENALFDAIAVSNLQLGLLFLTAAISFVTYFSTSTTYFSSVTALWFVEAFALLRLSCHRQTQLAFTTVLRRYSYLALLLAVSQVLYVIPTLPDTSANLLSEKLLIQLGSVAALWAYFSLIYRRGAWLAEEVAAMRLCATSGAVGAYLMLPATWTAESGCMVAAAAVLVLLYLSVRFQVLACFRLAVPLLLLPLMLGVLSLPLRPVLVPLTATVWTMLVMVAARYVVHAHEGDLQAEEVPVWRALSFLAAALALKICLYASSDAMGTLLWGLLAQSLLAAYVLWKSSAEALALSRWLFFVAFLKAILFDGNFVASKGTVHLASFGSLTLPQFVAIVAFVCTFFASAWLVRPSRDLRNFFCLLGLLAFTFESATVLYDQLGVLDHFQVLLSAFWSLSSFLFVAFGVFRENRLPRLFGLVMLVGTSAKICLVDIWVLNAYSQMTTFLVLGGLLMAVSFLYQTHRARLLAVPLPSAISSQPSAGSGLC